MPSSSAPPNLPHRVTLWMCIVFATPLIVYSHSRSFDFVNYDDNIYV